MGASSNDYDFFALDPTGTTVVAQSTTRQSGSQNPQEYFQNTTLAVGTRFVGVNSQGAAAQRGRRIDTERGRLSIGRQGNTFGHNAGVNTITLAAVPTSAAGGGQFTALAGVAFTDNYPVNLHNTATPNRSRSSPITHSGSRSIRTSGPT